MKNQFKITLITLVFAFTLTPSVAFANQASELQDENIQIEFNSNRTERIASNFADDAPYGYVILDSSLDSLIAECIIEPNAKTPIK